MANYDYEIVNGRKIRVRPKETVSEIDKNGYFRRQPNHFTTPFGDGENDLKAEGNKRYRLGWAKLCHWSNRAAIVRELEGLEDQISVNMVEHAPYEKNLGWEYVYNENNIDPVLGDQFLSEAYYRADDDYQGRTTVPALIDTTTGKVVNNDYNWLTTYFEVNFRPWHKKGAPELYPVELREEIDKMNRSGKLPPLADTREKDYQTILAEIRELPDGPELSPTANAKSSTAAAEEVKKKIAEPLDTMLNAVELAQYVESAKQFYGALEELETALGATRFLTGDFVTEADAALYVTLVRFDLLYSRYLGPVKYRVQDLKNVSDYLKDLYQIPAFAHHTDFAAIIRQGRIEGEKDGFRASTHYDLALPKIDWDAQWKVSTERAYLSSDPTHPIYLGNNRRFDIDPTWYDLGAESPKKEEKETPPSCGCCCG